MNDLQGFSPAASRPLCGSDEAARESILDEVPGLLPAISASIYCHGLIDEVLREVMVPFWNSAKASFPESCLWLIRYARGGQHLKIRLHAPAGAHDTLAKALVEAVEVFFAKLPISRDTERDAAAHLPPIDPEDNVNAPRPDRSLLWTRYRYSPELVGAESLSAAAGFEAAFVRCRAASTEVTLDWLDALESGEIPVRNRMELALQLLVAALCGFHSSVEARERYLSFQRDWLLRVSPDRERALAALERKVEAQPAQQTALGPLVMATSPRDGVLAAWCYAVRDLVQFCFDRFGQRDFSDLDGAADIDLHSAVSRVVHNAINLTAVGVSNEIYILHLMRSALLRAQGGPVA